MVSSCSTEKRGHHMNDYGRVSNAVMGMTSDPFKRCSDYRIIIIVFSFFVCLVVEIGFVVTNHGYCVCGLSSHVGAELAEVESQFPSINEKGFVTFTSFGFLSKEWKKHIILNYLILFYNNSSCFYLLGIRIYLIKTTIL